LVGTKTDLRDSETNRKRSLKELEQETMPLMNKYDDIEYVLECSARKKEFENIDDLFWHAQYGVLYPRMPLCNADLSFYA